MQNNWLWSRRVSPSGGSGSNQGTNQTNQGAKHTNLCVQPQMFWSHEEFKAIISMGNTTLAALATALQLDATGTKAQLLERIVYFFGTSDSKVFDPDANNFEFPGLNSVTRLQGCALSSGQGAQKSSSSLEALCHWCTTAGGGCRGAFSLSSCSAIC